MRTRITIDHLPVPASRGQGKRPVGRERSGQSGAGHHQCLEEHHPHLEDRHEHGEQLSGNGENLSSRARSITTPSNR